MFNFRKQFIFFLILIALGVGFWFYHKSKSPLNLPLAKEERVEEAEVLKSAEIKRVQIGDSVFNVELALTPAERQQGLSGHQPLKDDEGMLFVFEQPGIHNFWMKDMLFPIDILWISQDKRIVHIEPSLSPDTFPQAFGPNEPAQYVFEINAGLSQKNNFKIGDIVKFLP